MFMEGTWIEIAFAAPFVAFIFLLWLFLALCAAAGVIAVVAAVCTLVFWPITILYQWIYDKVKDDHEEQG